MVNYIGPVNSKGDLDFEDAIEYAKESIKTYELKCRGCCIIADSKGETLFDPKKREVPYRQLNPTFLDSLDHGEFMHKILIQDRYDKDNYYHSRFFQVLLGALSSKGSIENLLANDIKIKKMLE